MADWVDVASAAQDLGVSSGRVRQLLANGQLEGVLVGSRWLVDPASVHERLTASTSRPYSERIAWAMLWELTGRDNPLDLSRSELARVHERLATPAARWAPRLRRRATVCRFRCPLSAISVVLDTPDVVRSGVSATDDYGIDIVAHGQADVYMRDAEAVERLAYSLPLRANASDSNLIVRIPSRWLFGDARYTPASVVAADLVDSGDPRSVQTGLSLLDRLALDARIGS
jgi:Transcriptional regulator, AbiEi antitoxin, Type IV TA system